MMMTPENRRPVTTDDIFKLQFIQSAEISPDGRRVAYVVSTYDESEDADVHHIWLYNKASGTGRQLTFGQYKHSDPVWSPDGRTLAFISNRSGKEQLLLIPMDGGEARPLTNMAQGIAGKLAWSPDGGQIAFSARTTPDDEPDFSKPYRVSRHVYRYDGFGYLDGAVQNIYTIEIEDGEPKQLTKSNTRNNILGWSPTGDRLLYSTTMVPDSHHADIMSLRVRDIDSGATTLLLDGWGKITGAAWHPSGQQILFIGTPKGKTRGTKADLYLVDSMDRDEPENRTSGLPYGVGGVLLGDMPTRLSLTVGDIYTTRDGRAALVHVQAGGTLQIYRVALTGEQSHQPIMDGDRAIYLLGMDQLGETLLLAISDVNHPYELFMAEGDGRNERQLTHLNDHLLNEIEQARIEQLTFNSADGVEVDGWLILPAVSDGPFPTILNIHGGPHCGFGHVYYSDTQLFVGAGYAVLMINHRGSTGYGDAFATGTNGDWGNLDYADLMAGVDCAIETGLVDGGKLGVCGVSGGGYLSCWIIGHTDRFKAAVPENPVTNWHSFYGVSDIGVRFGVEQLGGHPHEIPEIYARCSPVNYAHNCQTPTLLIQGEADWRCPAEQSEQFYTVLKANGCHVEMLRLPDSSHAGSCYGTPTTRRAQNEALLEWMNRFVLGK
jgi:dipeptidyl aminopeptidase/acylaminoacyl peptidase